MSSKQSKSLVQNWQGLLCEWVGEAEKLAQSTQRKGKFPVEAFVQTLVLGCLEKPGRSLSDFVQVAQRLGLTINKSSFDARINSRAAMLLASVLEVALHRQVSPKHLPIARLNTFSALHIIDSTQIKVAPKLYSVFRGVCQQATLKVQFAVNFLNGCIQVVDCVSGCRPDQKFGQWPQLLKKNALLLFDLGYFWQETLRDISQAGAFFVTRCQSQVALYDMEHERAHLSEVLKAQSGDHFEVQYLLGYRVKTPVRLVAWRLAKDEAAARRRRAKSKAKRQGKTCSDAYLVLLDWNILITNLDENWSLDDLKLLYRIRWQIEIIFKVWKSQLGVTALGPWRPARVMCQFYGHCLGIVLCHQTYAHVLTSLGKVVSVVQQHVAELIQIIAHQWRGLYRWGQDLCHDLRRFAKPDRHKTKPSTLQLLMDWG